MEISSIAIEMTRRCNMTCEHCLRGDARNVDLLPGVIEALVYEIDQRIVECEYLIFTGGEPLMNHKPIIWALKELMKAHPFVSVPQFDIVTNGSFWHPDLILTLIEYHALCTIHQGESGCTICVSTDQYHDGPDELIHEMYRSLYFYSPSKEGNIEPKSIIDQGRAHQHSLAEREDMPGLSDTVYITYDGNVLFGCDYSYDNMPKHYIGNILEEPLSAIISRYREQTE